MRQREPPKKVFAVRRRMQQYLAPVRAALRAPDQAVLFQSVGQLHGAVMPDLQPFGEIPDCGFLSSRRSLDCQQSLMLPGLNAGGTCGILTEVQVAANFVPEIR